ncbi:MAG: PqiC family protein [Gammaproteobacteria bacterium]
MHRTSPTLAALCLLAVAMVSGCGTSSPARYYSLVPVAAGGERALAPEVSASIGPIRIAEYLKRSQIVTRGDGVRTNLAEFDLWTEPLAKSMQRAIADNVAALLGSDRILEFPGYNVLDEGYQVPAQVTRFDADDAGDAVLEVQWMVQDLDDKPVVAARRSSYTARVPAPGDYAAIVSALSELVGDFSRDVATALAELP